MTMRFHAKHRWFAAGFLGALMTAAPAFSQQSLDKAEKNSDAKVEQKQVDKDRNANDQDKSDAQQKPILNRNKAQSEAAEQSDTQGKQSAKQGTAWLGVMIAPTEENEGVRITDIFPDGPAAKADLQQGDVILSIDGLRLTDLIQVSQRLEQQEANSKVAITIRRDGEMKKMKVELGNRDEFLSDRGEEVHLYAVPLETRYYRQGSAGGNSFMLQQHRHLATQHQRLETMLSDILERLDRIESQLGIEKDSHHQSDEKLGYEKEKQKAKDKAEK